MPNQGYRLKKLTDDISGTNTERIARIEEIIDILFGATLDQDTYDSLTVDQKALFEEITIPE